MWGESAFEASRLHVQRLGRSGRIHFLSGEGFFVLIWMVLFASSLSPVVTLSTGISGNEPSLSLASPFLWLCILAEWGQTGPIAASLDEGTEGMAYTGEEKQTRKLVNFHVVLWKVSGYHPRYQRHDANLTGNFMIAKFLFIKSLLQVFWDVGLSATCVLTEKHIVR